MIPFSLSLLFLLGLLLTAAAIHQRLGGSVGERLRWVVSRLLPHPLAWVGPRRALLCSAVTSVFLVRPTGQRELFPILLVRMAPEDLARRVPDGDVERLEGDLAEVYVRFAERNDFVVPTPAPRIFVEADPSVRRGWIPRAIPVRANFRPRRGLHVSRGHDVNRRGQQSSFPPRSPARTDVSTRLLSEALTTTRLESKTRPCNQTSLPLLVLKLDDGDNVRLTRSSVIGRGSSAALQCIASSVSSQHASVSPTAAGWVVRDLKSTNGTWVDGARIQAGIDTLLQKGDIIRLGHNGPSLVVSSALRGDAAATPSTQRRAGHD